MRWRIVQDGDTLCAVFDVVGIAAHGGSMRPDVYAVAEFVFREDAYTFLGSDRFAPRLRDGESEDGRKHCPDCVVALANWDGE
jgi:hypothetical protein